MISVIIMELSTVGLSLNGLGCLFRAMRMGLFETARAMSASG